MNERDWADLFTHDVDHLLRQRDRSSTEPPSEEYEEALQTARQLAEEMGECDPQERDRLWAVLQARQNTARTSLAMCRRDPTAHATRVRRRSVLVWAAGLFLLSVLIVARPGGLVAEAAAAAAMAIRERFIIGPHTELWIGVSQATSEPRMLPSPSPVMRVPVTPAFVVDGGQWSYLTDLGGMGGSATEGNPLELRHFDSVDALRESAPYPLYAAHDLPEGYAFRESVLLPDDTALLFYGGPGPDILLSSSPVGTRTIERTGDRAIGEQVVIKESKVVAHVVEGADGSSELAQEVQVRGLQGIWLTAERQLLWEEENLSFALGGCALALEEALQIAESLAPVTAP